MNKRTLFLFAMTLPGALAATGCDRFFSYEQGKANKVVEYFNKLGPIYSQEMWPGGIGPNIGKLPAPRKKISPLETLGHTLECDLSKCYDTFTRYGKREDMYFKDPQFSQKLDAKMDKYISDSSRKACGSEFLVFHKDLPAEQYMKIFTVLQKHRCGVEVVAQQQVALPPVPPLKDPKANQLAKAQKIQGKDRQIFEKKWFQTAAAKCRFFDKFKQDTIGDTRLKVKEKILGAFHNPEQFADLDSCGVESGQIITALRAYVYGYEDKGQNLYSRSISFTDNEKNADIKIKKDQRNWDALLKDIWSGQKDGYQYVCLQK